MKQSIEQLELKWHCEEIARRTYLQLGGTIEPEKPESPDLLPTKCTESTDSKNLPFRLNNEFREAKQAKLNHLLNEVARRNNR